MALLKKLKFVVDLLPIVRASVSPSKIGSRRIEEERVARASRP